MKTFRLAALCTPGLTISCLWGCAGNDQAPTAATTLAAATENSALQLELPSQGGPVEILPAADVERAPLQVTLTEAEPLQETVYLPSEAELEAIEHRLQPLLVRAIDEEHDVA